jgi:predicted PurR-regulated permease PerM
MKDGDRKKLSELITTGNKILKLLYVLFIILLIYVFTLIIREWHILSIIGKILSIISPLFIGWFIAWLLNPLVKKMQSKGVKKTLSVIFAYFILLVVVGAILAFTLPSLGNQISDMVSTIPNIANDITGWINNLFTKLSAISSEDLDTIKASFMLKINNYFTGLQTELPSLVVNIISSVFSGFGKIFVGLIVGFYISFDFNKATEGFINLFPNHVKGDVRFLLSRLDDTLYSFMSGTLWLSLLLFVVSVIGFSLIGLNAPVLVAFICAVTNLIPYIGPYIGAAVAGAIGFTQSGLIGILTLVFILIVQIIDGEILNPLVMSKRMNLSPITIIISLLIFEYLFGILGMVIATPVVAILKILYNFFDEKYDFFGFLDSEKKE